MLDVSQGDESLRAHNLHDENSKTVTVYTRHKPGCANKGNPYWRRCRCTKYLYTYKNGASRQISARTRSWEKAEQKAQKIRESFELAKQSPRELRSRPPAHIGVEIRHAAEDFLKEIARLNREEATRKKYKLTLDRLSNWCAAQTPPVFLLAELDVPTLRRWILSWTGAPTTRHNQHQRLIAFFYFCLGQGWIKENPAKKIKNVPADQDETLPFTREQFEALLEATFYYDGRGSEPCHCDADIEACRHAQRLRGSRTAHQQSPPAASLFRCQNERSQSHYGNLGQAATVLQLTAGYGRHR